MHLAEGCHRHFDQPKRNLCKSRRQNDDHEDAGKIANPGCGWSQEHQDQVTERSMIEVVAVGNAAEEIQHAAGDIPTQEKSEQRCLHDKIDRGPFAIIIVKQE